MPTAIYTRGGSSGLDLPYVDIDLTAYCDTHTHTRAQGPDGDPAARTLLNNLTTYVDYLLTQPVDPGTTLLNCLQEHIYPLGSVTTRATP